MVDFPSWFFGLTCVFIAFYWRITKQKYNLPPYVKGLPVIGYLPFIGKYPAKTITRLSEKYGKIYCMQMGPEFWVVLNNFTLAKEAFNNPVCLDRPGIIYNALPDGLGMLGLNGSSWVEQRRYTMKSLKDIGIGTSDWENVLEEEVSDFIKLLENQNGQPVDISELVITTMSNNIINIILGKRLLKGDKRIKIMDEAIAAFTNVCASGSLALAFPKLTRFLTRLGLTSYAKEFNAIDEFYRLLREEVAERKLIPSAHRNEDAFIDGYLAEIDRISVEKGNSSFNGIIQNLRKEIYVNNTLNDTRLAEKNLIGSSISFLVGGVETSTTSLLWLLLIMTIFPEKQKEMDQVLGKEGKLKWMERNKLPYVYATIMEGQRWRTIVPLSVPRRTSEDTTIGAYVIPKHTTILTNIYALHNDPAYWENPKDFNPKRFLNEDGSLKMQKLESYLPFTAGRRSCPGQMIALLEIFHYFVAIMQKFHIQTADGKPPIKQGILSTTYQPVPQKLKLLLRE